MVTFENADGTVLQSGDVEKDTMQVYAGATPTKEEDDRYTYVFDKWFPELTSVTGPATYKATYTSTYFISFVISILIYSILFLLIYNRIYCRRIFFIPKHYL